MNLQYGMNVCLMNDSFPPTIDGVANCVKNYADIIENSLGHATCARPTIPMSRTNTLIPCCATQAST